MSSKAKPTTEQFLAEFPAHIQELANDLDNLIQSSVPESRSGPSIRLATNRLSSQASKPRRLLRLCYPTPDFVDIGFEYGILLEDQHSLLVGQGKQVRYGRFSQSQDIPAIKLSQLIVEAADIAFLNKEQKQHLFLKRDSEMDAKKLGPNDR